MLKNTLPLAALIIFSSALQASTISSYQFSADSISCGSEANFICPLIATPGLVGSFDVDLALLDASASGTIGWDNFMSFTATNGVDTWRTESLKDGGLVFENGAIVDFGVYTVPDWFLIEVTAGEIHPGVPKIDPTTARGWLQLEGAGFESRNGDNRTSASSLGGLYYCPESGAYVGNPESVCLLGAIKTSSLGYYDILGDVSISAVPIPAAAWLFGSALIGLFGVKRQKQS